MPRALEGSDTTVVIRPTPRTMWLWMFAFATALSWMYWKFSFYDVSWRALGFLLFPSLALMGAALEFIDARISVTTIDRARDLVLIRRRCLTGGYRAPHVATRETWPRPASAARDAKLSP